MGIEPMSSAWKAEVLPLNYTRTTPKNYLQLQMEGGGFEPPKAEPTDLQSAPFSHSGTPPRVPFTTGKDIVPVLSCVVKSIRSQCYGRE